MRHPSHHTADAHFLQALQQVPMPMLVFSGNGRCLQANLLFYDAFGYTEDELTGKSIQELTWGLDSSLSAAPPAAEPSAPQTVMFIHRSGELLPRQVYELQASAGCMRVWYVAASAAKEAALSSARGENSPDNGSGYRSAEAASWAREQEYRYRSIFDYHPDAVFRADLAGRFREINPAFERMFGVTRADVGFWGLHFEQIIAPAELERAREQFYSAMKGETRYFETNCLSRAGGIVRVSATYIPMVCKGKIIGVYGIWKDITTQEALWKKLRHTERLYHRIADHAQDIITYSSASGIVEYVSPSVYDLLGYHPEELIGQPYTGFVLGFEDDGASRGASAMLEHTRCLRVAHRDGHTLWFESKIKLIRDETGEIRSVLSVSRDISGRRQAEEALHKSENKYRQLIEDLPEGLMIQRDDRIIFANKTVQKLLGAQDEGALLGKSIYDFIHPAFQKEAEVRMSQAQKGLGARALKERLLTLEGGIVDVECTAFPMTYESEPALYIICRDITESQKTQELLQHSEKLTMVGQMAAGIAHEIRNPLTAIKGFIRLLQSSPVEKTAQYSEIITSEINRIEQILNELLVLAKPPTVQYRPKDVTVLLSHVSALIEPQAHMHNIEIVTDFSETLAPVDCDENQLKQVFINFMKNAVEAMPAGGELRVTAKPLDESRIAVVVTDQGSGMPPELLARIGQPFVTTKEHGTGLGMVVSLRIIEQHGGELAIDSEVGRGTTVEIRLPACTGPA